MAGILRDHVFLRRSARGRNSMWSQTFKDWPDSLGAERKGIVIYEAVVCPECVFMPITLSTKFLISGIMKCFKGKSFLMICQKWVVREFQILEPSILVAGDTTLMQLAKTQKR